MLVPITAMAIFIAVFALATVRKVHLGVLMFPAACGVGVFLARMPLRDVVGGFPVSILVLVAGVTYFFGIAQINGTIDRVIAVLLTHTGARPATLPVVFFALAAVASAMGSPQAGLVLAPVGMPAARRAGGDSVLMAIALNSGISAGAFAPTSLFGIVTYRIARQAGIDLNPFSLLAVAVVANVVILIAALAMFRNTQPRMPDAGAGEAVPDTAVPRGAAETVFRLRLDPIQGATLACMVGLVVCIIACALLGIEPDVGVIALGFGAVLTLIDPTFGARAFSKIDWSTAFVVGGIVTFVGVLQKLGSVDLLGRVAISVGTPLLAALVVCMIAALVSAFASTTGVLAALVPLAVPLAASGEVAGWALITALGVCATVVDASPFSNTGATLIASAAEEERPRLRAMLMRWGMSMVVVGPVVLVPVLVILSRL
jgi:di/tricarboxylate transporter